MQTHADCYFHIGKTHDVCEDYALVGNSRLYGAHALLSDGCSSSPHTDIGARMLCHGGDRLLKRKPVLFGVEDLIDMAASMSDVFIPHNSLDATLLAACVREDRIKVAANGDGVVAARRRGTGVWDVMSIDFSKEMPGYPRYVLNDRLVEQYFGVEGAGIRTTTWHALYPGENPTFQVMDQVETDLRDPDLVYHDWQLEWGLDPHQHDLVVLMSDGARAIYKTSGETMGLEETMERLLAFKGTRGSFVVRRAKRFLRDIHAEGWLLGDDFSVAALSVTP